MGSVLNISEREMGIVHYFLGLTMSLMCLMAGPPLTAHFPDNPGAQFTPWRGKRGTRRRGENTESENRAPDLDCLFMMLELARCVNNLLRN